VLPVKILPDAAPVFVVLADPPADTIPPPWAWDADLTRVRNKAAATVCLSWGEHLTLTLDTTRERTTAMRERRERRQALTNPPTPLRPDGTRGLIRDVRCELPSIDATVAQARHFLRSLVSAATEAGASRVVELADVVEQEIATIPALTWSASTMLEAAEESATNDAVELRGALTVLRPILVGDKFGTFAV
jgi:hypothetical protein